MYVTLDGGWGEAYLQRDLSQFKAVAPERFIVFGGVDWRGRAYKIGKNASVRTEV